MAGQIAELFKLVVLGMVIMLPLANPLTSMTMLLSLGRHIPSKERERQVTQAALYVVGIMLVTYYAGTWIIQSFGISIPGLLIAGGLIVAFIGFRMLFPSGAIGDIPEAEKTSDALKRQDTPMPNIALVPLALPGTAGPGSIAMIISATSSVGFTADPYTPWVLATAPVIVFFLLGALFWVCLRSADRIVTVVGHGGIEAITRVMGFLLVCMAVQFVINGILEVVSLSTT
jgi:multiple antibiotic resistance protein